MADEQVKPQPQIKQISKDDIQKVVTRIGTVIDEEKYDPAAVLCALKFFVKKLESMGISAVAKPVASIMAPSAKDMKLVN